LKFGTANFFDSSNNTRAWPSRPVDEEEEECEESKEKEKEGTSHTSIVEGFHELRRAGDGGGVALERVEADVLASLLLVGKIVSAKGGSFRRREAHVGVHQCRT
jgi:hypothetical protein